MSAQNWVVVDYNAIIQYSILVSQYSIKSHWERGATNLCSHKTNHMWKTKFWNPIEKYTAHCPLPTAHCLLSTAHCRLSTAHCSLPTVYCLLSTAHCSLPTVYCPLPTVYCSLPTVYCPLPTVYCPLITFIAATFLGEFPMKIWLSETITGRFKKVYSSRIYLR